MAEDAFWDVAMTLMYIGMSNLIHVDHNVFICRRNSLFILNQLFFSSLSLYSRALLEGIFYACSHAFMFE